MKAITTKCTATPSSYRYTATDSDKNRVTVIHNGSLDIEQNHDAAAIALCRQMRWDGPLMRGQLAPGSRVYVFDADANRVRFDSNFQEQDYVAHVEALRKRHLAEEEEQYQRTQDQFRQTDDRIDKLVKSIKEVSNG